MKRHILISMILFFFLGGLILGTLIEFSSLLFSQTEEKPIRHEVDVVLAEITLYVIDNEGNPVEDLKPEEIVLYENGKKQDISHFVLVQNDSPRVASVIKKYPAARRQFLLFFDFAFGTPARILRAREACLNFVKEKILPYDLVGVATYSGTGGLKILMPFSSDREQLSYTISTLGLVESEQRMVGPVGFSFPSFYQEKSRDFIEKDNQILKNMADDRLALLQDVINKQKDRISSAYATDFISSLKDLSLALNAIQGRKHIIYFSEGFDNKILTGESLDELARATDPYASDASVSRFVYNRYVDVASRFGDSSVRVQLYDALRKIANANCAIHAVDIGGLRTQAGSLGAVEGGASDISSTREGHDSLFALSDETGGHVFKNVNRMDEALEKLLKITNTHYIVGYYPENKKREGNFRRIKIKTSRQDLHITHRKGYYEPKPYKKYSKLEKKLQLVEYITKNIYQNDIEFESNVSAFKDSDGICQVPVFLKFPGRQFLDKNNTEIQLEIYSYAISKEGVFMDFFHQILTISPQKVREKLITHGIKYFDFHLLPPDDYRIKLIVRDKDTGKIGAQTQEIHVPDYTKGELGVGGPVFIQPESGWILCRGYDPKNLTGHKRQAKMSLNYPYVLGDTQIIPGVVPVILRSSPAQFFFRAYNLRVDPQTQIPETTILFRVLDMDAKSAPLEAIGLVQTPAQEGSGVYDFLFQANFGDFPSGPCLLEVILEDSLTNQRVVSKSQFLLQ